MQAVAEALGYSKMALYRHVTTKDSLLAVMIDAAVGAARHPPGAGRLAPAHRGLRQALWETWQATLAALGHGRGRAIGPHEVAWVEQAMRALDGTGLSGDERIDAVLLVSSHVRTTHSLAWSGTFRGRRTAGSAPR
jgi:AcrR family transcriptional regulator